MALNYLCPRITGPTEICAPGRPSENNDLALQMQQPRNEVTSNRLTMATDEDLFGETEDDGPLE
jgi:hypothetical protein